MLICSERKYRCITSRTNTSHAKIKKWNAELIWLAKAPFFAPRPPARPPAGAGEPQAGPGGGDQGRGT
jgi:hypothetical protein